MRSIRILIVEDEEDWVEALQLMYYKIFRRCDVKIESVNSAHDAVKLFKNNREYDLMSLDIHLGEKIKNYDPRRDPNYIGDGRAVLCQALKYKACKALVVITQLKDLDELAFDVPRKEDDIIRIKVTMRGFLHKYFPNSTLYDKLRTVTPSKYTYALREDPEFEKELKSLVGFHYALHFNGKKYQGEFEGEKFNGHTYLGMQEIAHLLNHPMKHISWIKFDKKDPNGEFILIEESENEFSSKDFEMAKKSLKEVDNEIRKIDECIHEGDLFPEKREKLVERRQNLLEIEKLIKGGLRQGSSNVGAKTSGKQEYKKVVDKFRKRIKNGMVRFKEDCESLGKHLEEYLHLGRGDGCVMYANRDIKWDIKF